MIGNLIGTAVSELGGKTLTLGAVVCILVYVAANGYVLEIEARHGSVLVRIEQLEQRLTAVEQRQRDDDTYHATARFTVEQGQELRKRIEEHERRQWHEGTGNTMIRLQSELSALKERMRQFHANGMRK